MVALWVVVSINRTSSCAGLEMTGCGEDAIRFRPMLTFDSYHCEQALDLLEQATQNASL